jgi:hypothetical protein
MCDQLATIISFIALYLLELKDKIIAWLTKEELNNDHIKISRPEDFDKNKPSKQL